MTGDEWPRTGELVEEHILSRPREVGIFFAALTSKAGCERTLRYAEAPETPSRP